MLQNGKVQSFPETRIKSNGIYIFSITNPIHPDNGLLGGVNIFVIFQQSHHHPYIWAYVDLYCALPWAIIDLRTDFGQRSAIMTLDDILLDIYALEDEMRTYERKYGVLSETFYEAYTNGEEPPDETWVQDWTAWASAYKIWLRRREQYQATIQSLRAKAPSIAQMIEKTARHEPIPVSA
jgi:hypothetical protein